LQLAAEPTSIAPGSTVQMTLSILGGFGNGGVFISSSGVGELQALPNQGLTKVTSGLVHNQPKPASGGNVTFRFAWQAPASPGAVRFSVYALGGNADGRSGGDTGIDGFFDWVFGCTGQTFYLDGDGDGYGRESFAQLVCAEAPPRGYAPLPGDCDDFRETTYPGAPELCNQRDDDCDGEIDENAVPVELWPDADGDGYYDARTEKVGEPVIGCVGIKGFAAESGDCRPDDPTVHAGAEETCNNVDDDCDGDIDERVRPTCGEGWCRREAPGCDPQYCTPGDPVPEKCNFLDDDCDGETDEDADMCPSGQVCAAGSCVDEGSIALEPETPPSTGGTESAPAPNKPKGSAGERSGCGLSRSSEASLAAVLYGLLLLGRAKRRGRRFSRANRACGSRSSRFS
jgi:hypothetical protein